MADGFGAGDTVQTPLGKGTVREVRNNGRLLVEVRGRSVEIRASEVSPLDQRRQERRARQEESDSTVRVGEEAPPSGTKGAAREVDLHGLTVDQALERAELCLNDALLATLPELRFIHGRSGGRIRGALHRWLRGVPTVRSFRLDPRNAGVTVVYL
jgi:dsDNA-specific endonuclease/ATPase MutS2